MENVFKKMIYLSDVYYMRDYFNTSLSEQFPTPYYHQILQTSLHHRRQLTLKISSNNVLLRFVSPSLSTSAVALAKMPTGRCCFLLLARHVVRAVVDVVPAPVVASLFSPPGTGASASVSAAAMAL